MKALSKRFIPGILLVALMLMSAGCGKGFDHAGYVQALLDSTYKGEHQSMSTFTQASDDELTGYYEEGLDVEVDTILTFIGSPEASDTNREDIKQLLREVYQSSSYDIGTATKDGTVEITVHPMNIIADAYEEMQLFYDDFENRNNNYEFQELPDEEFFDLYINGILDILKTHTNPIQYDEPVTVTVQVQKDSDGLYGITEAEFIEIDTAIINYDFP